MQIVVKDGKISFGTKYGPVCHVGTVNVQPHSPEFLFLTIKRLGIYILGIPDARKKSGGYQTVSQ